MKWAKHPRTRFLLAFIGIFAVVSFLVVRLSRVSRTRRAPANGVIRIATPQTPTPAPSDSPAFTETTPTPSPIATTGETPVAQAGVSPASLPLKPNTEPTLSLIIPVAGVTRDQLRDTFSDARSEGRVHDAIDIAAPQGTAVLAAADGKIIKLFHSDWGGTTIYQLSSDESLFYYYAHLDRYAEGLAEGQFVKQGSTIAYVGDTGNAGSGNYHLHFSIALVSDPKRYWEGVNINPYPLLRK